MESIKSKLTREVQTTFWHVISILFEAHYQVDKEEAGLTQLELDILLTEIR